MLLRRAGFTYSACRPFAKNKERTQNFKETRDSRYIYQNELNKASFQHDMADGYFKDLTKRTAFDKILCDKEFNIAKIQKYDGYELGLASMVYESFDRKRQVMLLRLQINLLENISNKELAEELHKPAIRKF